LTKHLRPINIYILYVHRECTSIDDVLIMEIIQHHSFCKQKSQGFYGRRQLLNKIVTYVDEEEDDEEDEEEEKQEEKKEETQDTKAKGEKDQDGKDETEHNEKDKDEKKEKTQDTKTKGGTDEKDEKKEGNNTETKGGTDEKDETEQDEKKIKSLDNHPLVIHGKTGSGVSSVMAKAAKLLRKEFPERIQVTRFVGCTPESTELRHLLSGICGQLHRSVKSNECGSCGIAETVCNLWFLFLSTVFLWVCRLPLEKRKEIYSEREI